MKKKLLTGVILLWLTALTVAMVLSWKNDRVQVRQRQTPSITVDNDIKI